MFHKLGRFAALAVLVLGFTACGDDDDAGAGPGTAANALSQCAVDKVEALADYCSGYFAEGATQSALGSARADLVAAWRDAEAAAAAGGLSCSDLALTTDQAVEMLGDTRDVLVAAVGGGPNGTDCSGRFFDAVGELCSSSLRAESRYLVNQKAGDAKQKRTESRETAGRDFLPRSDSALAAGCVDAGDVRTVSNAARSQTDALVDELAFAVVAAANVDQDRYITLSPTGSVAYEGRDLTPICMNGSPYHFFATRGTVNKLVMYYQGGGACWEKLTCSVPACDTNVNPNGSDNPNNVATGFADRSNPNNPFRNWHSVVVSYCGCDIHFGDAAQDYVTGPDDDAPLHVEHRGFHNAKVAEKWAREHFLAPEEVFVTGSSAGAYGAWFNAPLLHDVWPQAQFNVLADAGNGVITESFLENSFPNWNFEANLPAKYPDIQRVFEEGTGIPGYTEVVTREFPQTNWAHYTTAYDGGSGGQTGFYNIMLNDNDPIQALRWWNGSCRFNEVMRDQVMSTYDAVLTDNYRYYIGTGSRHTMFGSNKVYGIEDPDAPVAEQKITSDPLIVDWVNAMLDSTPESKDPEWTNFECEDCGLVLPGDVRPDPLQPPFETQGEDTVIVCDQQ